MQWLCLTRVNIQSGKTRGKIYPPIVIVEYGELMEQQISKNVKVTINYKVTFALKENHINSNIQVNIINFMKFQYFLVLIMIYINVKIIFRYLLVFYQA